ncbi:hypothetical protein OG520_05900 [Streptomyces sp. NBC_00984]|uniref:hypothetical protein n=1 Tax=Streptomyces sp. NBC_00984 TaxID=2903700 RepID=UPI00386BA57F|nr:hypothetical protein OG520_05900 [Streptomyces sp. NBC_00984]
MSVIQRSLLTAGMVAVAFGLSVTSASATSEVQWTVGNPNADGSFSGSLKAGTYAVIHDVSTGQQLECGGPGTRVRGSAPSGTYPDGAGLADVTTFSWGDPVGDLCHAPLGTTFTAELVSTTMGLDGESYAAGVVTGRLTDVNLAFSADTWLGHCTMTIAGSLSHATYSNATGELTVANGSGLTMSDVSNNGACMGLLNNGDSVEYSAAYVLDDPITVTSP